MPFVRRSSSSPSQIAQPEEQREEKGVFDWVPESLMDLGETAVEKGVEGLDWLTDTDSTRAKIGEKAVDVVGRVLSPVGSAISRHAPSIPEPVKAAGRWATTPIEAIQEKVQDATRSLARSTSSRPMLSGFVEGAGEAASEMTSPLDLATTALPTVTAGVKAVRGTGKVLSAAERVMGTLGRQVDDAARLRNTSEVVANSGQVLGKVDTPLPRVGRTSELPYHMADEVDPLEVVSRENVTNAGAEARYNRGERFRDRGFAGTMNDPDFTPVGGEANFNIARLQPNMERGTTSFTRAKVRAIEDVTGAAETTEAIPEIDPSDLSSGVDQYMPNRSSYAGTLHDTTPQGVPIVGTPADASDRVRKIIGRENRARTGEIMRDERNLSSVTRARGTKQNRISRNVGGNLGGPAPDLNQVLIDTLESMRAPGARQIDNITEATASPVVPKYRYRDPMSGEQMFDLPDGSTVSARRLQEMGVAVPEVADAGEDAVRAARDAAMARFQRQLADDVAPVVEGEVLPPIDETPAGRVQSWMNTHFGLFNDQQTRGAANMLRPGERTIDLVNELAQRDLGPGFKVKELRRWIKPSGEDELSKAIRQRSHIDEGMAKRRGIDLRDETGSADPALLRTLAGAGAGAAIGAPADPSDDPIRGGAVGALLGGALGGGGVRGLLRMRRGSMLSGMALPKSIVGNVAGVASEAGERALSGDVRTAARILNETFLSPRRNMREFVDAFKGEAKTPVGRGSEYGLEGPLSIFGRLMGAGDITTRRALTRAGVDPLDAERVALVNSPDTALGRHYVTGPEEGFGRDVYNEALPFRKTATNVVERGLERTPVVGEIFNRNRAPLSRRLAEQTAGAGAMALGAGNDDINDLSPAERGLLIAMMGRYGVPFALGTGAMRPLLETLPETDPVQGIQASKTAEENAEYLIQRYLRSFVPPDLR